MLGPGGMLEFERSCTCPEETRGKNTIARAAQALYIIARAVTALYAVRY